MLKRLLVIQWPVSAVIGDESITKADRALDFKSEQWTLAKDLLPSLQKIEIATVYRTRRNIGGFNIWRFVENMDLARFKLGEITLP